MACGKPVIASLDGIGAEILKSAQAGFASPAEDVDALVKIILDFISIDEDAKNKLGKNARSYFEKHFERELLLTRLESILSEV